MKALIWATPAAMSAVRSPLTASSMGSWAITRNLTPPSRWIDIGWIAAPIKYSIAAVLWVFVLGWLRFGGRGLPAPDDAAPQ